MECGFQQKELIELVGRRSGEGDVYGRFRVTGLTFGWRNPPIRCINRLFPAPAHLVCAQVKDESGQRHERCVSIAPTRLRAGERTNFPDACSSLLEPRISRGTIAEKPEPLPGWLTAHGLGAALGEFGLQDSVAYLHRNKQIYERKSRLGIGMDNATRTAREGYLYQAQMIRMQSGYGFVVDVAFAKAENGRSATSVREPLEEHPQALAFLQGGNRYHEVQRWVLGADGSTHTLLHAFVQKRREEGCPDAAKPACGSMREEAGP